MRDEEYRKELTKEEKLNSILPYIGQSYSSSTGGGTLTLSILDAYHQEDFNDDFSVVIKSLDDITKEDAMEVYKIALGGRREILDMTFSLIKTLSDIDEKNTTKENIEKYAKAVKKATKRLPEITIHEQQFHVDGGKMLGRFDFWHGHKALKELHFGFETENSSSYAEYSCMNPHMIIQFLQSQGYMIPYNGVDLFDDGIASTTEEVAIDLKDNV